MNVCYVLCYLKPFKRFSHILYNGGFTMFKIKLYFFYDQEITKRRPSKKDAAKYTYVYKYIERCIYIFHIYIYI